MNYTQRLESVQVRKMGHSKKRPAMSGEVLCSNASWLLFHVLYVAIPEVTCACAIFSRQIWIINVVRWRASLVNKTARYRWTKPTQNTYHWNRHWLKNPILCVGNFNHQAVRHHGANCSFKTLVHCFQGFQSATNADFLTQRLGNYLKQSIVNR